MHIPATLAIFSLFTSSVYAFCGTHGGTEEERAQVQRQLETFSIQSTVNSRFPRVAGVKYENFSIPVVWNVFYDENNAVDGNITETIITKTHKLINSLFLEQVGLTFHLDSIRRIPTDKKTLHSANQHSVTEKKLKKYRIGDKQTLNIFTIGKITVRGDDVLAGWGTFPWLYESYPENDGIMYDYNFLPEGKMSAWNSGKVLVHEIGHWLGLYHTFEGGCEGNGDFVDDTPYEEKAAKGCPVDQNSCPDKPGMDPVNNLMDYSSDTCRTEFTPGQYERIAKALFFYRGINLYPPGSPDPEIVGTYSNDSSGAKATSIPAVDEDVQVYMATV